MIEHAKTVVDHSVAPSSVLVHGYCRRAISVHTRQSGPDSDPGFQVKVLGPFQVFPSSLGSSPNRIIQIWPCYGGGPAPT